MIVGYINDKGVAYDKITEKKTQILNQNMEIILEENEKIISEIIADCDIKISWNTLSGEYEFDSGKGTLVKTNKRFLFFREIKPMNKIRGGASLPSSISDANTAKKLKDIGLKEFFEIRYENIYKVQPPRVLRVAYVAIFEQEKKYLMLIYPDEVFDMFKEFPHLKKGEKLK